MTTVRRVVSSRLFLLALAICCVALQFPAASAGFVDPDFAEEHGSRPMPRPDSPGAANAFRQLQWNDERGWFPENGLVEAIVKPDWSALTAPCVAALASPRPGTRFWAAFELGRLRDPAAIPALERATKALTQLYKPFAEELAKR